MSDLDATEITRIVRDFLEIDIYSTYGPQVFYLKVTISNGTAYCLDFMEETTQVSYTDDRTLIEWLFENFNEAFMLDAESIWTISASAEIEDAVRALTWNRLHHNE